MAFKSYGGLTWSSQPAEPYNSTENQLLKIAVGTAAGAAGMYAATRPVFDGYNAIDYGTAYARRFGNLSPFQLLNTFRVPEILSPFNSLEYKAGSLNKYEGTVYWGKEYFATDKGKETSTYDWIKKVTGSSDAELKAAGVSPYLNDPGIADNLVWEPVGNHRGTLSAVKGGHYNKHTNRWEGGTRTVLSDSVALRTASYEQLNPLTSQQGLNRIAQSDFAAMDMYAETNFDPQHVFAKEYIDNNGVRRTKQATHIPIPSVTGRLNSFDDLLRRTNIFRGVAAFEMDRFNRLLGDFTDQFFGEGSSRAIKKAIGISPGVRPGPASAQFARFGFKAAGAGAIMMGASQLDYIRRRYETPGQLFSSSIISAGLGYGVSKLTGSPNKGVYTAAASFFGQMILPGFDKGIMEGLATGAVSLDILRANSLNPFNYLRRTLEGFAPGISDSEVGALASIAGVSLAVFNVPGKGVSLGQHLLNKYGPEKLGLRHLDPQDVYRVEAANRRVRDEFYNILGSKVSSVPLPSSTFMERRALMKHLRKYDSLDEFQLTRKMNDAFAEAEQNVKANAKNNPMNEALMKRLHDINQRYGADIGFFGSVSKELEAFGTQAYYSFFGANLSVDKAYLKEAKYMGYKVAGRFGKVASVGLAIFGLHGLATGGLLGSKETSDDLRAIYSGKKLVEVKSSRWWEAGGTPFEGGDTAYFRPHQYVMMMNRVRERGIWGEGEDNISPIEKFLIKNFTYNLEEQNYWERPYPITSAAFSDIPIIGGVLASTIGKFIKPARIMHASEWMRDDGNGGIEYASVYKGSRVEPAFELGADSGMPTSPFSTGNQLSEMSYQFRELEGMTGWAKNLMQAVVTGSASFNTDSQRLADSGLMTSPRVAFWEGQFGGALFTNEFLRRILPSYRSEVETRNPIANRMPSWIPDKFKWGDPYRLIEWGEARLPGKGYEALHPELSGMDPEAYPLLYKYAILSDIAPMSMEYALTKEQIYQQRAEGYFNDKQIAFMEQIDSAHYQATRGFDPNVLHERAITLPGSEATRKAWSNAQSLIRSIAAPAEYLVPMGFRPTQKLLHDRDVIEQYEYERLYGTQLAFWDQPIRDWIRPSFYSTLNMLGWDGKPVWRQEADAANAYFDRLEFQKWSMLREQAIAAKDHNAASRYKWAQANTRAGVNPQGSALSIYWTIPENERKFFNAFAYANEQERARIQEMIPEDQIHLYKAIWSRIDSGDETLWAGQKNEISEQHLGQQKAFVQQSMAGQPSPPPDWVGWHQDVDMGDVKVRYVDKLGAELADYGLWEKQLKKSMQQPFLEGSSDFIFDQGKGGILGRDILSNVRALSGVTGNRGSWQVNDWSGMSSSANIDYNDNRSSDITFALGRYLNAY